MKTNLVHSLGLPHGCLRSIRGRASIFQGSAAYEILFVGPEDLLAPPRPEVLDIWATCGGLPRAAWNSEEKL